MYNWKTGPQYSTSKILSQCDFIGNVCQDSRSTTVSNETPNIYVKMQNNIPVLNDNGIFIYCTNLKRMSTFCIKIKSPTSWLCLIVWASSPIILAASFHSVPSIIS